MYAKRLGVQASEKEAIQWFRFYLGQTTIKLEQTNTQEQQTICGLAKNGIATAQYYLGELYRDGIGVSRKYKWAYMWYYLSALQGNKK